MNKVVFWTAFASGAIVATLVNVSDAMAGQPTAVRLPEPGLLGLVAVGVIGVIAASRWRK